MQEMGEQDVAVMWSLFKYGSNFDPSLQETPSHYAYHLVNPDDHDRIVIDPAYRLEKTKRLEEMAQVEV